MVILNFNVQDDLMNGEEVARCPSCSLLIRVIYDPEDFIPPEDAPEEQETKSAPLEASTEITVA